MSVGSVCVHLFLHWISYLMCQPSKYNKQISHLEIDFKGRFPESLPTPDAK